jgi:hypothetical protein
MSLGLFSLGHIQDVITSYYYYYYWNRIAFVSYDML